MLKKSRYSWELQSMLHATIVYDPENVNGDVNKHYHVGQKGDSWAYLFIIFPFTRSYEIRLSRMSFKSMLQADAK